jgi:hypothetical protein
MREISFNHSYFFPGGTSVQDPCAISAAMPMLSPSVVGMDGFADVYGVCAHLDGQGDFADHVTSVGAYHALLLGSSVRPTQATSGSV